jgi:hypothetical protein
MDEFRGALAQSELAEVPLIDVGDSRATFGGASVRSKMREVFAQLDCKFAAIYSHGLDGNNGNTDGISNFNPAQTGITYSSVAMGATVPGPGFANNLPVRVLRAWTTSTPNNPHFGYYGQVYSTAGVSGGVMNSTALVGSTGGTFKRGDPAQSRDIQSITRFAVTDSQTGIYVASRTSFGYGATNFGTHGPVEFGVAPSAPSGELLITRETMTHGTTSGAGVRAGHRHISSPAVGTGTVWAGTEIRFGTSGIYHCMIADGGYRTTDHLPQTTSGRPTTTEWKYTNQGLREFYKKVPQVAGKTVVVRVCLGQNQSALSGYAEWDGTSLNAYSQNIEAVADRHIAELLAEGAARVVPVLETPWQSTTDSLRINAMRAALYAIALRRGWVFFDLQAELLAGNYSTPVNGLDTSYTMHGQYVANGSTGIGNGDYVHAGFAGANIIGTLANEAIKTAPQFVPGIEIRSSRARGIR